MDPIYLMTPGKAKEYMEAIQAGSAPARFTQDFLEGLGFKSKNDRKLVSVLISLGFLDSNKVPTQAYRDYLDSERAPVVLGNQLKKAYGELFTLLRDAPSADTPTLVGKFKSLCNIKESTAEKVAMTFRNLSAIAEFVDQPDAVEPEADEENGAAVPPSAAPSSTSVAVGIGLAHRIEINLPNTTNIDVYHAIFRSLKENLLDG